MNRSAGSGSAGEAGPDTRLFESLGLYAPLDGVYRPDPQIRIEHADGVITLGPSLRFRPFYFKQLLVGPGIILLVGGVLCAALLSVNMGQHWVGPVLKSTIAVAGCMALPIAAGVVGWMVVVSYARARRLGAGLILDTTQGRLILPRQGLDLPASCLRRVHLVRGVFGGTADGGGGVQATQVTVEIVTEEGIRFAPVWCGGAHQRWRLAKRLEATLGCQVVATGGGRVYVRQWATL